MKDLLEKGQAVGIDESWLPIYVEGQAMLNELVEKSRAGLDALADHMPDYLEAWYRAYGTAVGLNASGRYMPLSPLS